METQTFDYVIVGGGSAGCVLANRLSADPNVSVCLLEAGRDDNWHWINIPVGYLYCIANPRTDWMFRTTKEAGLNGRDIHYARGRGLGGCSLINAMIYMRGQARDYNHWAEVSGDASWNWQNVLPMFRKHESHHLGATDFHGADGELRVEEQRLSWDILDRFREAAREAGIPYTDDFNRGDNAGSGKFEVTQKRGVRWHASKAFLKPVMHRPNLTVVPQAWARKLRLEGRRCTGVEAAVTGQGERFYAARREVVVASGSIGSPQLLQLSGIGDPALLQQHQVAVNHALPGVGANLQDHLQLRTAYKVSGILTLNEMAGTLFGKAKMALEYALHRTGPLTMAPSQLGIFWKSDPGQPSANIEYHVQPLSLEKFGDPLHPFPAFTASVCNLHPTSRGHVRIQSAQWDAKPEIHCAYLSTDEDRKVAADALRLTRKIAAQPALAPYHPEEFVPGPQYQTDEQLAEAAGKVGTTIFHPVGTCKMGRANDPTAVVDSHLRVIGLEGLRVADASIMPTITSGNTNAPSMMIAEKAAAMILKAAA
ncbi:MAG TPA: GMC family oxidoreductase N-terminal domain-containing protein [Burkholderiales bacterium]